MAWKDLPPFPRIAYGVGSLRLRHGYTLWRPLFALERRWLRRHRDVPVVVITGSAGKTTTRALLDAILSRRFSVVGNPGNRNADILLHESLAQVRSGAGQVLLLECGIKNRANADNFNRVLEPEVVVLTNVGDTHLAWLGNREGVRDEKLKFTRNLKPGGRVVVNADDDLLAPLRARPEVIAFGMRPDADFAAHDVRADPTGLRLDVVSRSGTLRLRSRLLGTHNVHAILAAVAVAAHFGVPDAEIAAAVAGFEPRSHRLARVDRDGLAIIDDTANANPQSMRAALAAHAAFPGRKIAVLGGMAELGEAGRELHRELGRWIAREHPGVHLFTYGALAEDIHRGAREAGFDPGRSLHWDGKLDLLIALRERVEPGDAILVKGSKALRMMDVVEHAGRLPWGPPLAEMPPVRPVGAFRAARSPDRRHQGIDLAARPGTPVFAFADGRVLSARYERGYGRVLRVEHFQNVVTVYAHLSRILVRRGAVRRGQPIALTGRSGIFPSGDWCDYPHLHFEVRLDGVPLDPGRYVEGSAHPSRESAR